VVVRNGATRAPESPNKKMVFQKKNLISKEKKQVVVHKAQRAPVAPVTPAHSPRVS
jgi:hypothetical protein